MLKNHRDKLQVEIANTQTKAKQQDKDLVAKRTSSNQQKQGNNK